jgi:hypothetical protein
VVDLTITASQADGQLNIRAASSRAIVDQQ